MQWWSYRFTANTEARLTTKKLTQDQCTKTLLKHVCISFKITHMRIFSLFGQDVCRISHAMTKSVPSTVAMSMPH